MVKCWWDRRGVSQAEEEKVDVSAICGLGGQGGYDDILADPGARQMEREDVWPYVYLHDSIGQIQSNCPLLD